MSVKSPNPVDAHVGSRVKLQRLMLGMSQERLASQLDITFQQIQKYEKGTNRIGASRLQEIARILGVPVGFFFQQREEDRVSLAGIEPPSDAALLSTFMSTGEGVSLNRAFLKIKSQRIRKSVVALAKAMARSDDRNDAVIDRVDAQTADDIHIK